jgi:amino acid transporter
MPPSASLARVLTLRDLVLFHVVAIVGVRWYLTAARTGPAALWWWTLAILLFFLPQGIAVVALSRVRAAEGGVYVWARDAFGPFHGFLCGWAYWVNNLTYYPSLVLFVTGNALWLAGAGGGGAAPTPLATAVATLVLWTAAGWNLVGVRAGRWLQNAGAVATWTLTALLVAASAWTAARSGAPHLADARWTPAFGGGADLAFLATLCFALAGLELAPSMADEVKDAGRTIPRSVLWAAPAIAATYVAGTLAVLVAMPPDRVDVVAGIADAMDTLGDRLGLSLGAPAALLVVCTGLGGLGAWFAGSARIPFAIGLDRYLPAAFARVHPRWGTPHWALGVQAAAATLFLWASALGATVEGAYLALVNATIVVYFVPYLYLFAALLAAGHGSGLRPAVRLYAGLLGLATTALAMGLAFVPPDADAGRWTHAAKVGAPALGLLALGAALYALYARRARRAGLGAGAAHGADPEARPSTDA